MNSVMLTVALIAVIGLIGSIILVVGSRVFAVEEDERLPELVAILPGANCGSCGYPGCEGYAKAMLNGAACNSCGPGGAAVAAQLA
ncbi:MAG: RnfABCDGE type electron transport complex subunit B, partial [Olsenella sp.]|nr:RnfABCDGE type electron transport complex subunit B [Olsenella sp.]